MGCRARPPSRTSSTRPGCSGSVGCRSCSRRAGCSPPPSTAASSTPSAPCTWPAAGHPRWLAHLKPLLSGIYTADNMDYVLRDAYMCGVAVGPIDIERIMYYSFFSDKGLTLDRSGIQAFIMFLNARFYMYTNVYYHRTTRGIDLHLKEIFRDTMRLIFPYDLRRELHPYLHMTEWTLLEEVSRWEHADDGERKALAQEWRQILDRRLKWRMSHEVVLDLFEPQRGRSFMKA